MKRLVLGMAVSFGLISGLGALNAAELKCNSEEAMAVSILKYFKLDMEILEMFNEFKTLGEFEVGEDYIRFGNDKLVGFN